MALNLLKLCVGCDSVEDLEEWIEFRLDERRRAGEPAEHWHTTRMVPTRTDWQPRRAFQGWRYLKPADAPVDLGKGRAALAEMPPKLRLELAELGLL
jgi:hypothetical protein